MDETDDTTGERLQALESMVTTLASSVAELVSASTRPRPSAPASTLDAGSIIALLLQERTRDPWSELERMADLFERMRPQAAAPSDDAGADLAGLVTALGPALQSLIDGRLTYQLAQLQRKDTDASSDAPLDGQGSP